MPKSTTRRSASTASPAEVHPAEPRALAVSVVASRATKNQLSKLLANGSTSFVLIDRDQRITLNVRLRAERSTFTEEVIDSLAGTRVDWDRGTISNGKERTSISRTEMRLLACFLEHPNEFLPARTLAAAAWADIGTGRRDELLEPYLRALSDRLASVGAAAIIESRAPDRYRLVAIQRQHRADRAAAAVFDQRSSR